MNASNPSRSSRPRWRAAVVATVVLGGLSLSGWLMAGGAGAAPGADARERAAERATPTAGDHRAGGTRAPVAPAEAHGWYGAPTGSWFRYFFENRGTYGFAAGKDSADRTVDETMAISCHGELELQVLERRDGHADALLTFAEFAVDGSVNADTEGRLAALLHPVVVRVSDAGEILGYRFAADLNGEQRNFQRWIVATFGFPVGGDGTASWVAGSADATGEYRARFDGRWQGDTLRVDRRDRHYVAMNPRLGARPQHSIEGHGQATLSRAAGWLVAAEINETLILELPMFGTGFVHRARIRLELRDSGRRPCAPDLEMPGSEWHPAGGHREDLDDAIRGAETDRWRRQLRSVSLDQLVLALEQLMAGSDDVSSQARYDAWTALSWYLRLHPEATDALHARILGEGRGSQLASTLLSALGNAGTPRAQDALIRTYADPSLDPTLRNEAALGMFAIAEPTEALLGGLTAHLLGMTQLAPAEASAMLALGALAARHDRPVMGDQTAMDVLLDLESVARRFGATDLWLQALGNAGTSAVLDRARPHLRSVDPRVRAAAVTALRNLSSDRAVALLADVARHDRDAAVRVEAIRAMAQRFEPAAREALHAAARSEADASVRRAAILAIASSRTRDAAGLRLLEQIQRRDPSPALRALVADLLQP